MPFYTKETEFENLWILFPILWYSSFSSKSLTARVDALLDQEADMFAGWRVGRYTERFGFAFLDLPENAHLKEEVKQVNAIMKKKLIVNASGF